MMTDNKWKTFYRDQNKGIKRQKNCNLHIIYYIYSNM